MSGERVVVSGVGYTPLSRESGRTVLDLALTASSAAIADAGLRAADVDGMICFHENDSALVRDVATGLGAGPLGWWGDALAGGNFPGAVVAEAGLAIEAGLAEHVLVYRALNGRSGRRMGQFRLDRAGGVRQFMLPHGFGTPPQVFGMVARRFMHETGLTREHLAAVAIEQRRNACRNERAVMREPLDREAYFAARQVAEPLCLFDCCQETDGGCALVVSRAGGLAPERRSVRVVAAVSGAGGGARYPFEQRPDLSRGSLASQARALFGRAGLAAADVDLAELYDAFTFEVAMQLEELGFVGRGEAGDYIEEHGIGLESPLPVNTHGGLLSEGYVQGLNHVCEAVLQLRGECGERQVPAARVALVTGVGFGSGSALILVRDDG